MEESDLPESNQRPKDFWSKLQSSALPTELRSVLIKSAASHFELCLECEALAKINLNTSVIKFGQLMCENFCDLDGEVVGLNSAGPNAEEKLVCDHCRKLHSQFMCSLCNPADRAKIIETVLQEEEDEDDDEYQYLPPAARKSSMFTYSFNDTTCDKCIDRGKSPFCFQCSLKEECKTCNNTIECKSCNLFRKHTVHVSMLWNEGENHPQDSGAPDDQKMANSKKT